MRQVAERSRIGMTECDKRRLVRALNDIGVAAFQVGAEDAGAIFFQAARDIRSGKAPSEALEPILKALALAR